MQIAYDVELEDLVALHAHHLERSPALRRQVAVLRLACAGLALLGVAAVGVAAGGPRLWVWLAGGVVGAVVGYVAFPRWFRGATLRQARRRYAGEAQRGLLGRHHLAAEDDGLRARSAAAEHFVPWEAVDGVARASERVFVTLRAGQIYVLPTGRVVGGDLEAFLAAVASHVGPAGSPEGA